MPRPLTPAITATDAVNVKEAVGIYEKYHSNYGGDAETREKGYADMVNKYYDLATSFYEFGWGTSFHFAHRYKHETHTESIKRHEHYLALKLELKPGMQVLDVGCGVGGPLRELSLFSGASIVGLNNNAYQLERAKLHILAAGLRLPLKSAARCSFVKGDFMAMPFEKDTFDAVYQIEATCHAPDPVACYKEVLRVLKPGASFAGYEWCSTSRYDSSNAEERGIMADIELGNGLPTVRSTAEVTAALKAAGFEVLETRDLAPTADVPWWQPLAPGLFSLSGFRTTLIGRLMTRVLVATLEAVGLTPAGSLRVHNFLERALSGLVAGGKKEIFTPMFFFIVRKPAV